MVYNWPVDDVDVIVVTDGSRVLALGDLGCNSMNIPIGKLSLYVSAAGISPSKTLPIVLDVGTDNLALRENPLYLGLNRERLRGKQYYDLLDEWLSAIRHRWPDTLIQFEDFASEPAETLLERYRVGSAPCFNDDIQSTGCIAIAALLSSLRTRGKDMSDIDQERIVCVGAGSAGVGVCEGIVQAMQYYGVSAHEAYEKFYMLDESGLLARGRNITGPRARFVRQDMADKMSLFEVIKQVKPTVLLGLSGVGGLFTEKVVREMARHVDEPVIFPMSNPSSSSECTPEQVFEWTDGRAVVATGSPFANVTLKDGRTGYSNQANNVYSFPGMGLAVTVARISCVTDEMFLAAGRRIAQLSSEEERADCGGGVVRGARGGAGAPPAAGRVVAVARLHGGVHQEPDVGAQVRPSGGAVAARNGVCNSPRRGYFGDAARARSAKRRAEHGAAVRVPESAAAPCAAVAPRALHAVLSPSVLARRRRAARQRAAQALVGRAAPSVGRSHAAQGRVSLRRVRHREAVPRRPGDCLHRRRAPGQATPRRGLRAPAQPVAAAL
ncbi:malic enzyme [Gracilaria domingensis]|nr:malic enzyme [Gracilaria domingensis]